MDEEELFRLMDEKLAEMFPTLFGDADDVNKRLDEVKKEIEAEKNVVYGKVIE